MLEERTGAGPEYLALEAPRPAAAGAVKRRYRRIGLGLVVSDALCACAALLLVYGLPVGGGSTPVTERLLVMVAAPALWVTLFHAFSLYGPQRLAAAEEFRRVIGATSLGIVLLALIGWWSQHSLSRLGVGLSWLVALFLELLTRRAWRWYQHRLKLDGRLALRTLIIGTNWDATRLAATLARQEGIEIRLSANIAETLTSRLALQQIGPVIALSLRPVRLAGAQAAGKRAFDLAAASVGLLLTLPLWIVAAATIRLTSPGAVLFHQERVTKGGRRFSMHKFRTMRDRPEGVGDGLDPVRSSSPFFKLGDDPRVTAVGRYLRRFSLDELPQLLNILQGDMSLVGPRPLPAEQVAANAELLGPRHEVPAGMTGWWQINGRSEVTPEEALQLDQFYIENWSLTLDLYILLKTFGVVLRRQGAW